MMRFRLALLGLVLVASAATARAQVNGIMLPVPPLPSIGLPLPRIGLPPVEEPSTTEPAEPGQDSSRRPRRRVAPPPVILVSPIVVAPPPVESKAAPAPAAASAERRKDGTLELPPSSGASSSVFVDGYFVGTGDRIGRWLQLEAGPHTIELRADGQPLQSVKVQMPAGQTVSFEEALGPISPDVRHEAAPGAAVSQQPLYVIPGCYAGNVPPVRASLPRGCDPALATTLER